VPDTVRYAFYAGGAVLLGAIAWTVLRTREYPPEERCGVRRSAQRSNRARSSTARAPGRVRWHRRDRGRRGLAGVASRQGCRDEALYMLVRLLAGLRHRLPAALNAAVRHATTRFHAAGHRTTCYAMPSTMRRLAVVQFFSWFALFAMWIYTTAAVTEVHLRQHRHRLGRVQRGANWVGVLFAAYNGFAALAAIAIPWMARRSACAAATWSTPWLGGLGLLSMPFIRDPQWLLLSMVGVGFAWASILSLPYAMLSDSLPARRWACTWASSISSS
jgi:maltose/moltooligosaccharide transporter